MCFLVTCVMPTYMLVTLHIDSSSLQELMKLREQAKRSPEEEKAKAEQEARKAQAVQEMQALQEELSQMREKNSRKVCELFGVCYGV